MGGVIIGHETAALWACRRCSSNGRTGCSGCAAACTRHQGGGLLVEDVVTTGLSSTEAIAAIEANGATVIAAASLVDRSGGTADLGVPFTPLIRIDIPTYSADDLPPDLAALPATKPGSRAAA